MDEKRVGRSLFEEELDVRVVVEERRRAEVLISEARRKAEEILEEARRRSREILERAEKEGSVLPGDLLEEERRRLFEELSKVERAYEEELQSLKATLGQAREELRKLIYEELFRW
jgi:hypothetical protein|uniref:V-type ATP synthase subunit H n=1 Tax=Thermofilum pendens TaxID=2269 RepID=A0A7C3WMJ0_THEPE